MDIREINDEIRRLEGETQTHQTISIMAALYTVRDHAGASESAVHIEPTSEFLMACACCRNDSVLAVMDELMSLLQAIQPKLYDGVMRRLRG